MKAYHVTFELADGPVTIAVGHDEFILKAARAAGLNLPSLCEQGWCITCAARVLEGNVEQSASRRFYKADGAAGFALLFTANPVQICAYFREQHRRCGLIVMPIACPFLVGVGASYLCRHWRPR